MTDDSLLKNEWMNRPDFKPYPAMIPKEWRENDVIQKQIYEANYSTYKAEKNKEERKKSAFYRLVFPNKANYELKDNYFRDHSKEELYDKRNGYFPTRKNDYRDHV